MAKIQAILNRQKNISFYEYMTMALYDPDDGYYASDIQRVGKQGDFLTSVSIGSCFGMILAQRIYRYWLESEKQPHFHIIEPGAHDGSLCADILQEIQRLSPDFYQAVHYHLIDATPNLITAQQKKLSFQFKGKFTTHTHLHDIHNLHGSIISNELIDAFPVELIQYNQGQWWQMMVELDQTKQNTLKLIAQKVDDPKIQTFLKSLGNLFPDGYTTEYNPGIETFTQDASHALQSGLFITIDYGHSTKDLYHPDRTEGTLQTYHRHQKSDNPLEAPGEIDITTHIDFTRLITAAESYGFQNPTLRTQASYLTDHARAWLLDIENPDTPTSSDTPNLIRQFQTLIHPAMLGTKFTVLEMTKSHRL